MEYIAFGEVLFEEHSSSFSSPYLFNGKELDRETNLSYFGTNKEGNFICNNVKGEYVLNTSDRGGAENSFLGLGKVSTTYAGGNNPKIKEAQIDMIILNPLKI